MYIVNGTTLEQYVRGKRDPSEDALGPILLRIPVLLLATPPMRPMQSEEGRAAPGSGPANVRMLPPR